MQILHLLVYVTSQSVYLPRVKHSSSLLKTKPVISNYLKLLILEDKRYVLSLIDTLWEKR